jgi:F0F1-type ATP synthase epsilon subunit
MADAETPALSPEEQAVATTGDPKKLTIDIKVYAPFKIYYEGKGSSISAVNETGPFDILPHHHNFLCMLVPGNLIIETPEGRKVIKVSRALMHVKADRVVVFMDV